VHEAPREVSSPDSPRANQCRRLRRAGNLTNARTFSGPPYVFRNAANRARNASACKVSM